MSVSPLQLLAYVLEDDLDVAIDAGLMDYRAHAEHAHLNPQLPQLLVQTQQRLARAWAARERYRARQARLQRRLAQRQLQRAATLSMPATTLASKPALPTAAAAILARAKARAAAHSLA